LRPRHIDAVAVGICLLLSLPFCFARVNPLMRPKDYAAGQEAHLEAHLEALRSSAAKLAGSVADEKGKLEELRRTLDREKIELQSARQVNSRIARLTELAARAGLEVDEVAPGKADIGPRYETVPLRLRGSGSYPTCAAFLCQLIKTFPDTSVVSFELSGDPQKPRTPGIFHVNLRWYAAREDPPNRN
jgi:Tfp pilus assembly protein PilO